MSGVPIYDLEIRSKTLFGHLDAMVSIANLERESLGFIPIAGYEDAIARGRIIAQIEKSEGVADQLVGFILYGGVFPHASVQQIGVLQNRRRSGIASSLIDALVSRLEQNGFMSLKASVASDLESALNFYAQNGFNFVRERAGGKTRNRVIKILVRELDTDSLFSGNILSDSVVEFELGAPGPGGGDAPFYALDLNVLFDLIRNRDRHDEACRLFGAALAHQIRLVVSSEFLDELNKTSLDRSNDPVLQMAKRLPMLPAVDPEKLDALADRIHDVVFVVPNARGANTPQAVSDSRHIAHSALSRATAFITSDRALLNSGAEVLSRFKLDVASLEELVNLLTSEASGGGQNQIHGQGFETKKPTALEMKEYLQKANVPTALITKFISQRQSVQLSEYEAIVEAGKIVATSALLISSEVNGTADLLVYVDPGHTNREIFSDYLIDQSTRRACVQLPTRIQLAFVPGQSGTHNSARLQGFVRSGVSRNLEKVALGQPSTPRTWARVASQVRRRTGLVLPQLLKAANTHHELVQIKDRAGHSTSVSLGSLEEMLSPAILAWPGRSGVIAPISKTYADDLLGTGDQMSLSFVKERDAAFYSKRAYVNDPRTAKTMRPGKPIFFYESIGKGVGRGAVVAVAKIVDSVVSDKNEFSDEERRRTVIDDFTDIALSSKVLLSTFESLLVIPKPVELEFLKEINATGGNNLITAFPLSSEQMIAIIEAGWSS